MNVLHIPVIKISLCNDAISLSTESSINRLYTFVAVYICVGFL